MSSKIYPEIEDHLETFLLYWLDTEVNKSDDNITGQKQIRSIIKHLQTFDDQDQCQQTIKSLDEQNRLILIVSGRIGRELVPQIHQLRQISSIYVYCQDKSLHEAWATNFFKV
jgi:DNA-directed RNA polymerase specialized sigma subunit